MAAFSCYNMTMKKIILVLKFISYIVFVGALVAGIWGVYDIMTNFGSATTFLIAPTVFIVVISVMGLISTYHDY